MPLTEGQIVNPLSYSSRNLGQHDGGNMISMVSTGTSNRKAKRTSLAQRMQQSDHNKPKSGYQELFAMQKHSENNGEMSEMQSSRVTDRRGTY